jgi:vacuolar protein sorting-associated protein 35
LEVSRQSLSNEDFVEEQNLVARLCSNLKAPDDPDQQYHIIRICQERFKDGGLERMRFTYPPMIMQAYALAFRYKQIRDQVQRHVVHSQEELERCSRCRMKNGIENVKNSFNSAIN